MSTLSLNFSACFGFRFFCIFIRHFLEVFPRLFAFSFVNFSWPIVFFARFYLTFLEFLSVLCLGNFNLRLFVCFLARISQYFSVFSVRYSFSRFLFYLGLSNFRIFFETSLFHEGLHGLFQHFPEQFSKIFFFWKFSKFFKVFIFLDFSEISLNFWGPSGCFVIPRVS